MCLFVVCRESKQYLSIHAWLWLKSGVTDRHFTCKPTRIPGLIRCNVLNIDWSKKRLKQELWRKNLHFVLNTHFLQVLWFSRQQNSTGLLCLFPKFSSCVFTCRFCVPNSTFLCVLPSIGLDLASASTQSCPHQCCMYSQPCWFWRPLCTDDTSYGFSSAFPRGSYFLAHVQWPCSFLH